MALKFIESQNAEFKSNYCEANNALVEIERVSARKLNTQTAVELDTLLPDVLDKAFKREL